MTIRAQLLTGLVSTAAAITIMAGWQYYRPAPTLNKVDIIGIVTNQQKSLSAKLKPDMDEKAQAELIASASKFGKQLDTALTQVATECNCTLINSAAIVKDSQNATRDYTQRVVEIITSYK